MAGREPMGMEQRARRLEKHGASWLPCAFVALFLLASPATARAEPEGAEHESHGTSHGFHKNVLGVFAGVTHSGRDNAPTVGIEYSRRFTSRFGVGAVVEYAGGDADLWVAAIPFIFHAGHWKLYAGPGLEDGHHGTEALVRLGVEYAFPLSGGWEIAPQANIDIVDGEEVWVFGVLFAKVF